MILQLAWRNIWRNPRRTGVILVAVVIGVWCNIFLSALNAGMLKNVFDNNISILTGHIQIHHKGYRNDPAIENSMKSPREVENVLNILKSVLSPGAMWATRVRVGAVANNARHSRGVTLVGIDPPNEAKISFIGDAVEKGRYLEAGDDIGIIVGRAMLDDFETEIGNKLVLMAQDTQKEIASRAFRIVGVYRAELENTEKQYVFVTKAAAQTMLKLGEGISEISVVLPEKSHIEKFTAGLKAGLSDEYEVHDWKELLPMVRGMLEMSDGYMFIWYMVVFIAMGFGIVNTTLMAVFERMREFGMLKAMGMKPLELIKGIVVESSIILVIGMIGGNLLALATISIFAAVGIDLSAFAAGSQIFGMSRVVYPEVKMDEVILANAVVLILGVLISFYPAVKAARFSPVEAMTHN